MHYLFSEIPFMYFCKGPTVAERELFREISKHYVTEESTTYLANILLKNDDCTFIDNEQFRLGLSSDWSKVAYGVIFRWADTSGLDRTQLLRAMEKSNVEAAKFFSTVVTFGQFFCQSRLLFLFRCIIFSHWLFLLPSLFPTLGP